METAVSLYSTAPPQRSVQSRGRRRIVEVLVALVFLLVVAAIAGLEAAVSMGSTSGWFGASAQVIWTPPTWFSRTVWVAAFLLVALVGWIIWRRIPAATRAWPRMLYVISLVLLAVWPPVYLDGYPLIGTTALWIAFVLAFLLVTSMVLLAARAWSSRRSVSLLLVPVVVWLLYVTTINLGDAVLASL
jgi:tryptophan-rich sensory protein